MLSINQWKTLDAFSIFIIFVRLPNCDRNSFAWMIVWCVSRVTCFASCLVRQVFPTSIHFHSRQISKTYKPNWEKLRKKYKDKHIPALSSINSPIQWVCTNINGMILQLLIRSFMHPPSLHEKKKRQLGPSHLLLHMFYKPRWVGDPCLPQEAQGRIPCSCANVTWAVPVPTARIS